MSVHADALEGADIKVVRHCSEIIRNSDRNLRILRSRRPEHHIRIRHHDNRRRSRHNLRNHRSLRSRRKPALRNLALHRIRCIEPKRRPPSGQSKQ